MLDVDKFLVSSDKMLHLPDLNIAIVKEFMKSRIAGELDEELANKGKEAYKLIKKMILEL